jgi:hypothetical protein
MLGSLTTRCTLKLTWVPGHTGIERKQMTDQTEPFFGYNSSVYKVELHRKKLAAGALANSYHSSN